MSIEDEMSEVEKRDALEKMFFAALPLARLADLDLDAMIKLAVQFARMTLDSAVAARQARADIEKARKFGLTDALAQSGLLR